MTRLKNKILALLMSMMTLFLLCVICVFNVGIYNRENRNIDNTIESIGKIRNNPNPMFVQNELYEVIFNRLGNIDKIISYSPTERSVNEIRDLITQNISKVNRTNLYLSTYVLRTNREGHLFIVNNVQTRSYLISECIQSMFVFILLEAVIVFVSRKITQWIIMPVQDAFDKQKQFISDASHELKTPISIVRASVETLENSPEEKKWREIIKEENERMATLVSSLLELAKTEDMKEKEAYGEENLSKLIMKTALSFESLMFENQLELVTDIEENITFYCSGNRIKELLRILMDNAIKHGEFDSQIVVKLSTHKNHIVLSVMNKGDEIPLADREKIFERFYRVDKSRNRNENRYGLGLSIAKNIVLNHNGTIKVSCEYSYTTFIVTFKQN
ncbi:MAG: HAMP domain-containing sensor histidine kinase [Bacillota bacterium]|nr:HAMP domain-containing sensor histidine kinase [Bacillota bacterium]